MYILRDMGSMRISFIRSSRGLRLQAFLHCLLMGLTLTYAAAQEPAQRHSLLRHPNKASSNVTPHSVPLPVTPSAGVAPRMLHHKLTQRPSRQSSSGPTDKTTVSGSPSRATINTGQRASITMSPPVTQMIPSTSATPLPSPQALGFVGASVTPLNALNPSATTTVQNSVAGVGAGVAGSAGGNSNSSRAMQRLASQMPGLTQLLTPTTSVSPTPPSSQSPTPTPTGTGSALLTWTLTSDSDVAGYKIYVGTASGQYNHPGSPISIGRTDRYTVSGLPTGQTYFFAISAYSYSGSESGLSAEVSKSIY